MSDDGIDQLSEIIKRGFGSAKVNPRFLAKVLIKLPNADKFSSFEKVS